MIGNVQRTRDAPARDFESARKDPVGVHAQSRTAPGGGAGRNRRRVTARFEKPARRDAFLARERVEVAHDDGRIRSPIGFIRDYLELGQLTTTLSVRVDVNV